MSEAPKFTPGPWRANRNDFYWEIQSEPHGQIGGAGASNTIYVDGIEMERAKADVIAEANAHLMAAAPDMLASLKGARSALDRLYEGFLHNSEAGCEAWDDASGFDVCSALDAAIAKAEGTQP